jgi:HlyD family secretion protein
LKGRLVLIGFVLAVMAFLVYAFLPNPVEVDVGSVTRGLLQVTVNEEGKTRIRDRYVVSAPLAGRMLRLELRAGDKVVAGETILANLEPGDPALLDERARAEIEARVKAAIEATRLAKENHQISQADLDRARKLHAKGSISQEEFEHALNKERTTHFSARIAEFELQQARAALVRSRPRSPGESDPWRFDIRSPITGRVLRVFQESAAVVAPGTRLLELGDPSDLELEIDVLSQDGVKVAPGNKIILEHWGGERPLLARVRLIEPAAFLKISALGVEEQRVNVIGDFVDPPEKRLRLGDAFRVEARIVIWEADDVLTIPAGALFRHADGWAVFMVVQGRASLRPVQIGRSNGLETQVVGGLEKNDRVILYPSDKIRDGGRVLVRQ